MWRLGQELVRKFEELTQEHGGVDCKDIARVDWTDQDAVKAYYRDPNGRKEICFGLIGDFAHALGELIEEEK